jgi:tetratricopeptide (TPR) repeat protein
LAADHQAGIAGVLEAGGNFEEALEVYRQALEVHQEVVDHDPTNLVAKNSEVWTRLSIGAVLRALGNLQRSIPILDATVAEARALSAADPNDALYRELVADSLSESAAARGAAGDLAQAAALREEALSIRRELLDLDRQSALWTAALAAEHLALGEVYQDLGRPEAASAAFVRGLEVVEPVARGSMYPEHRMTYARTLLHLDRPAEARAIIDGLPPNLWHQREFRELCLDNGIQPPGDWSGVP